MNFIQWINCQHSKSSAWYVWEKKVLLVNLCQTYTVGFKLLLEHEIKMKQVMHPSTL